MKKCERISKKEREIIKSSVAHLNGYALVMKETTGYKPVAVNDNIKQLKKILRRGCK